MINTVFFIIFFSFSLSRSLSNCSSFDLWVKRQLKLSFAICFCLAIVFLGHTFRLCDIHYGDQWLDQQWAQRWARRWAQHITQRQIHWINRPYFQCHLHRITLHHKHSARINQRICHLHRIEHTKVIAA